MYKSRKTLVSEFKLSTSPAFRLALLLVTGILLGRWCVLPPGLLVPLFVATFVVVAAAFFLSQRHPLRVAPVSLAVVLLCVLAGAVKDGLDSDRSSFVPGGFLGHDVILLGTVVESPHVTEKVTRFLVGVHAVKDSASEAKVSETVRVSLTRPKGETGPPSLQYGMNLALSGRIFRPSDSRNPGEFSEKQYYEANGITLFMLVRGGSHVVVLDSGGGHWFTRKVVVPVHDAIIRLVDRTTTGESAEFLKGLLIGERSGITVSTRQAFTNSGVAHVLAVSGSNVVVVAGVFFFLFGLLRLPKWGVVVLSVAALLLYMQVTGSQPPVVRATVIASIFLIGSLLQAKPNPYNALGAAATIILASDARQLFDVGFQLSFVAVLSIVYLYPKMNRWIAHVPSQSAWGRAVAWALRVCAVSLAATLGTLPITAVYFGQVSVIGLLANIVVIPAVGGSVVLGFVTLFASVLGDWLAQAYAAVNQVLLDLTLRVIQVCGTMRFASVGSSRFVAVYALPFYAALLLVFNLDRKDLTRTFTMVLLLTLNLVVFVPAPPAVASGNGKLRVTFLDVGQGDASVVEFPDGRTVVIDTGPRSGEYDAGERIVAPFLRRRGISTIDLLVLSHPHDDHCGGASYLVKHFRVPEVLETAQSVGSPLFQELTQSIHDEGCGVDTAGLGMSIRTFADARIYIVAPSTSFINIRAFYRSNLNNTSLVARLQYGEVSILFAGDAEKVVEEETVRRFGGFLRSTILKAGHHGSITSSSPRFLDVVHPDVAVISVGLLNKFGHPSADVIARLHAIPSEVYRTDEEGAVMFESDGKSFTRVEWR